MKKVYHKSLIPSFCKFIIITCIFLYSMQGLTPHNFTSLLDFSPFIIIAFFIYLTIVYSIKKSQLIIDDEGVWYSKGILPWNKGSYGYDWNVIESAAYYPNFSSWLMKAYKVEIRKLFKDDRLVLSHIKNGKEAVMMINKIIKEKQNSSVIISNQ